jgi:hypothetical protein
MQTSLLSSGIEDNLTYYFNSSILYKRVLFTYLPSTLPLENGHDTCLFVDRFIQQLKDSQSHGLITKKTQTPKCRL